MDYSSKYQPASSSSTTEPVEADDLLKTLEEYLPQDFLTNHNKFIDVVRNDYTTFKPLGEKIHEYTRENDDGSVEKFEIFKVMREYLELCVQILNFWLRTCQNSFSNAKFREYHSHMQLFVLLFIEGSSYIEDDDEKWEIYTRYGGNTTSEEKNVN